jgi:hypothetical protein
MICSTPTRKKEVNPHFTAYWLATMNTFYAGMAWAVPLGKIGEVQVVVVD